VVREVLSLQSLSALEPGEAAALFIMRRADGLTASEEQLLTEWLARNETHRRAFDGAERAWQSFAGAGDDEILTAMRRHALAPRARAQAAWRPAVAAAAVLLVVVGAAVLLVPGLNPWAPASRGQHVAPVAAIDYASARGEVKEIQLPDGSGMTLDADSVAIGHFDNGGRTVDLQRGRAFFAVMSDRSRPFAVTAAGRSVVATGTRFDVNLVADGLTVTLLEGRVEISSAGSATPLRLEPGQQYVERAGKATIRTIGSASENSIVWRRGLLNFDDQSLAEAAAEMNRYSGDRIVIRDPEVASKRVSGQFRAGAAERFASTLAEMHKLQARRTADGIELVRE